MFFLVSLPAITYLVLKPDLPSLRAAKNFVHVAAMGEIRPPQFPR